MAVFSDLLPVINKLPLGPPPPLTKAREVVSQATLLLPLQTSSLKLLLRPTAHRNYQGLTVKFRA